MSFLGDLGKGILGAVTGGVSGLIGSGFGLINEAASNAMSLSDQKELMKYQYDLQQQGINVQNEYNKPINQMARLYEAGLNPHLVYGNGSVVGNTSDAASASLGKARTTELAKYNQMAQELTISRAIEDNKNQQKTGKLIEARTLNEKKDAELKDAEKNYYENQNIWFDLSLPTRQILLDNELAISANKVEIAHQTANRLIQRIQLDKQIVDAEINQITNSIALSWKRYEQDNVKLGGLLKLWSQTGTAAVLQGKAAMIRAITGRDMFKLTQEQWNLLGPEILRKLRSQNFGQELRNKWTELIGQSNLDLNSARESNIWNSTHNNDLTRSDSFMLDIMKSMLNLGEKYGDDIEW